MQDGDLLLITDMQNVYKKNQPWACLDTEGVAKTIVRLCSAIKDSSKDIQIASTIFLPPESPVGTWKDYNVRYADINSNQWMNAVIDELKETVPRFPLYKKSVYSSIKVPEIRRAAQKAKRVILTGVVAECCVLFTAFDAIDLGCKVVYLRDACSGFTKEKEAATELTLQGLSPLHVLLMNTDEYIKE